MNAITRRPLVYNARMTKKNILPPAARQQTEMFAKLHQFLPGFIYRCQADEQFTLIELAGKVAEVTGFSTDQLLAKGNFAEFIHPHDRAMVSQIASAAIANKSTYQLEYRLLTPTGAPKWVWESGMVSDDGELLGFISDQLPGLGRQDRLMAAQKLVVQVASSDALSQGLLNEVATAIGRACTQWLNIARTSVWLLNEDQTQLDLVTLVLGSSEKTATGLSLLHKDYPRYFQALVSGRAIDAVDARTDPRTSEFAVGYLDVLNIHSMMDAAIRNGERIIGVVCCEQTAQTRPWSADDINFAAEMADQFAHTLANRQARLAQEHALKAEASNQAKSQFLATISHELRTPLNGVLGMAELLQETRLSTEQREIAQTLQSSGELLLSVINDVLDFSKIEAGKLDILKGPVFLQALIPQCASIFRQQAALKSIDIVFQVDQDLPAVNLDGPRFQQVLANLISNAIKFSDQGAITVAANLIEKRLKVTVTDQGRGISDELQMKLFQPFEQERRQNSAEQNQGTGLGLAISKRLIEAMQGTIKVHTQLGQGSTFEIDVPYEPAEHYQTPHSNKSHRRAGAEPLTIWIAEDNAVNQRVIEGMLRLQGVFTKTFDHGELLILALNDAETLPDMIFMDYEMPVKDGLQATREIRANPTTAGIPIIGLSAHALSDFRVRAHAAGMDDYLTKPIQKEELIRILSRQLIR